MAHEVLLEQVAVARELLVEPAERRALVAGDQRAGGEAAAQVGAVLVEHEAHESLHAGDQDAALLEHVLVVEADLVARVRPQGAPLTAPARLESGSATPHQCRLPRHW